MSIIGNVTDFLGSNTTKLECSFDVRVFLLQFFAKNKTGDIQNIISIADGDDVTFPSGEYLKTRVDVTKITASSRNATVTFNELRCADDLEYACKITFVNDGTIVYQESNYSSISVRGKIIYVQFNRLFALSLAIYSFVNLVSFPCRKLCWS